MLLRHVLLLTSLCVCHTAQAGVSYSDPVGGWRYTFAGDPFPAGIPDDDCVGGICPPGFGAASDEGALDGTWSHDQGDKWDSTAPGDPLGDYQMPPADPINNPISGNQGPAPGGAGIFSEGNTSFLRIQDTGNPEDTNPFDTIYNGYVQGNVADPTGPDDPINNNRRIYFGHLMRQDGPLPNDDELILTNTGVTLSFRARIPGIDQIDGLDDIHQQDTDMDGELNVTPWFENAPFGHGAPMVNGRGTINVAQNAPDNTDTSVGFSLVTSADIDGFCENGSGALCTGTGSGGLIMNNLAGDTPGTVDSESPGTLNILEMADEELNEWHEFWITMENNGPIGGNIEVNVYMDGDVDNPATFQVTLSGATNAVYKDEDDPYLEFGFSADELFGSIDLDFVSYQFGIVEPVAAPPMNNGDYNGDGVVNAADYTVWQDTLGSTTDLRANGDDTGASQGVIDRADYDFWVSQFGNMVGTGSLLSSAPVPEPSSALLWLVLGGCLVAARHKLPIG